MDTREQPKKVERFCRCCCSWNPCFKPQKDEEQGLKVPALHGWAVGRHVGGAGAIGRQLRGKKKLLWEGGVNGEVLASEALGLFVLGELTNEYRRDVRTLKKVVVKRTWD